MALACCAMTAGVAAFPSNNRDRADGEFMLCEQPPENKASLALKFTKEVDEIRV